MKSRVFIAGIILIILVAGLIYYARGTSLNNVTGFSIFSHTLDSVSAGNTVAVMYTGTLENGTIFDTSDEEVAKKAGIYNPQRPYEPLEFVVGAGQMIKGFDEGVRGMKIGEKKKFILTPDQAYGTYDPTKMQSIPRIDVINRTIDINKSIEVPQAQFKQLFNDDPKVGQIYTTTQVPFKYQVKAIKTDKVVLEIAAKVGDVFILPQTPWSSEVIEVGQMIKLRHNPKDKQIIPTAFGNATLEVNAKNITINVQPLLGAPIQTPFGQAVIKSFNATSIILDLNHPLAGKTLMFDVEVVNITQSKAPALTQQNSLPLQQ